MPTAAARSSRLAVVLFLALLSARCAQAPDSLTGPTQVHVLGAAPQAGVPPPPGDSLGTISALGATKFLAFGDSLTCGSPSSFDQFSFDDPSCLSAANGYPLMLRGILQNVSPSQTFTVVNEGKPGEWAVQALSSGRFAQRLAAERPQGLLLLEGINDLNNNQGISATVNALQQMIELARLYNTTVLVSEMFQTCVSTSPSGIVRTNAHDRIVPFNSALRSMAAGRQNVHVVDLYTAFGDNCGPDGGIGLLGPDGLHPKQSGYSVIATTFSNKIRSVFAVRGSFQ